MSDYELISKKHALYSKNIARYRFLYNSYIGGDTYRNAGYLTRYQLESDAEYQARLSETPLDNHVQSVISVYNSFLFRETPYRELNSIANLTETEDFLMDADLEGRSFDAFMREVNTWSNVFGHAWIMVSKPNIQAVTRADELVNGVRPYVSVLTPMTVYDWNYTRQANGRYVLDYLKYVEDVNGDIEVIKEWTPELIRTSVIDNDKEEVREQTNELNQLGTIPAVICYSERSIVRGIGVSSVSDIADQQRYIFNALSEACQSIRLDSHPSLVVATGTQVGTGAGAIIEVQEGSDPGLKPYVLDFAGASIDAIHKVIDNSVKAIEKMAHLGGVRSTQSQAMSGVALETEFQLLNSRLSSQANNLVLAEEGIWRLFCQYQNQPYDVLVQYPDSFSIRDSKNEIQQLLTASTAASSDPVKQLIDAKIRKWLGDEPSAE